MTIYGTLTKKSQFFTALLNTTMQVMRDLGNIFIDKDPRLFDSILYFMRYNIWRIMPDLERDAWAEAEYYGIDLPQFSRLTDDFITEYVENLAVSNGEQQLQSYKDDLQAIEGKFYNWMENKSSIQPI